MCVVRARACVCVRDQPARVFLCRQRFWARGPTVRQRSLCAWDVGWGCMCTGQSRVWGAALWLLSRMPPVDTPHTGVICRCVSLVLTAASGVQGAGQRQAWGGFQRSARTEWCDGKAAVPCGPLPVAVACVRVGPICTCCYPPHPAHTRAKRARPLAHSPLFSTVSAAHDRTRRHLPCTRRGATSLSLVPACARARACGCVVMSAAAPVCICAPIARGSIKWAVGNMVRYLNSCAG